MSRFDSDPIRIEGLEKEIERLEKLGGPKALREPMAKTAIYTQKLVMKYPKKMKGAFSMYATKEQKRAYWAKVSSGEITHNNRVGYVRSRGLGRSWTVSVAVDGRWARVETVKPHAPYVMGPVSQQRFHKATGWKTLKEIAELVGKSRTMILMWKKHYDDLLSRRT